MSNKRSFKEWKRRCISFVFSLFILGIGVSLAIRANLGSSPITCPPYVISMVPSSPLTVGGYIFCMQFFFVLLQFALLRKDFENPVSPAWRMSVIRFIYRLGHVADRAVPMGRHAIGIYNAMDTTGCFRLDSGRWRYMGSS